MAWSCHENEVRIPKQALHWEVAGFRRPGRPRMNWRNVVKKDLQRMGSTLEEVEASAQDRHSWRYCVALCVGDGGKSSRVNSCLLNCHECCKNTCSVYLDVTFIHRLYRDFTAG